MTIYERIIELRNNYQGRQDYDIKCEILLKLMSIAFYNADTLPSHMVFSFSNWSSTLSPDNLREIILEILQQLGIKNIFWAEIKIVDDKNFRLIFNYSTP